MQNTKTQGTNKLKEQVKTALKDLEVIAEHRNEEFILYSTGKHTSLEQESTLWVHPRNSFLSAFLLKDPNYLRELLRFCVATQGKKIDPFTGEEPGKIIHEFPGVVIESREKSTLYSSADTTPLFLIGFKEYYDWTKDAMFIRDNLTSISLALEYLLNHVDNGIFWDHPSYAKATHFALLSTSWRDRGYSERENNTHDYPASYLMVNIFVLNALSFLADICQKSIIDIERSSEELYETISALSEALFDTFWLDNKRYFASAIDQKGIIDTLYLDSVWPFYFLPEGYNIAPDKIHASFDALERLKTTHGFVSREPMSEEFTVTSVRDESATVWMHEHAYLFLHAQKFDKKNILKHCLKPFSFLTASQTPFAESLKLERGNVYADGLPVHLWTVASIYGLYLRDTKSNISL